MHKTNTISWETIDSVYYDKRVMYDAYFVMCTLSIETICIINVYKGAYTKEHDIQGCIRNKGVSDS